MVLDDPYDLQRFVHAQDEGGAYCQALAELRNGRKTSHWMWFVFPQIEGLGLSAMARRYAIESAAEAVAYVDHELLGERLVESAQLLLALTGVDAVSVFGSTDAMKLKSSMTLFASAYPYADVFENVLARYFDGKRDERTEALLAQHRR